MDTLKIKVKEDTIKFSSNTVVQHTTIETIKKECNDCSTDWCNCAIISDLIWPITILIVIGAFYKKIVFLLQVVIDRINKGDDFHLGKDGFKLQQPVQLRDEEIKQKAENEFTALTIDKEPQSRVEKQDFVPQYLRIERDFYEILLRAFYPKYKVLSNRRLDTFEYDVILESTLTKDIDYIIEVKYFLAKFDKHRLKDAVTKLVLSTKHYIYKTNREARPVLVIIVKRGEFSKQDFKEINEYAYNTINDFKPIGTLVVFADELQTLTDEELNDLINYR